MAGSGSGWLGAGCDFGCKFLVLLGAAPAKLACLGGLLTEVLGCFALDCCFGGSGEAVIVVWFGPGFLGFVVGWPCFALEVVRLTLALGKEEDPRLGDTVTVQVLGTIAASSNSTTCRKVTVCCFRLTNAR